jgi:hypothetical protein
MITLTKPSFNRRLLQAVREQVASEPIRGWDQRDLQLCLDFLRRLRENAADMRRGLEEDLAGGIEARSFVQEGGPFLQELNERIALVQELVESLSPVKDAAIESLVAELRSLDQENKTSRDLLAEALARASEPPRPIDWNQLKRESDADFAAGRFTTFATPEDMLKGLEGGD